VQKGNIVEWQPIETAPKDGTRILLFRQDYEETIAVCYYSENWNFWKIVLGNFWANPTHWMPLPPPTKE
jgi:hypothetical protein